MVSYGDLESRWVKSLPDHVKTGFIYAKAARNEKICSLPNALAERALEPIHVDDFITTYMLKTCLMTGMSDTRLLFKRSRKSLLRNILTNSTAHGCAYALYVMLYFRIKEMGSLPFFFDSIDLFQCKHELSLNYDDKLGCCLKRALILGFCESIMQSLKQLVPGAEILQDKVETACWYAFSKD